jgi:hypothetical protein
MIGMRFKFKASVLAMLGASWSLEGTITGISGAGMLACKLDSGEDVIIHESNVDVAGQPPAQLKGEEDAND